MSLIKKLKGDGAALPPKPATRSILFAWIGGFLAISAVALLDDALSSVLVLGSFGASCVLVFGFPHLPFSQPRNVVCGHVLSSLIGLACLTLLGSQWWAMAIAVGTAIAFMMLTRTVHPPAGSNPVIVFLTAPTWEFLVFPTLAGALIIVLIALIYNNMAHDDRYPKYW
ncbi:MAG: HPP family protein [Pseudomonadota bacterium]